MVNTVGDVKDGFVSMGELRRIKYGATGIVRKLAETVLALQGQLNRRDGMSDEAKIIKYEHHGTEVCVREDLKGMHRQNCLCFHPCGRLNIQNRAQNCKIANALYDNAVQFNVVTPVFECPAFITPEDLEKEQA